MTLSVTSLLVRGALQRSLKTYAKNGVTSSTRVTSLNTRLKGQCQAYKKTIEVITKELRAEANVSGYREAAGKRWFRRA